jgi:hypothetical protein
LRVNSAARADIVADSREILSSVRKVERLSGGAPPKRMARAQLASG